MSSRLCRVLSLFLGGPKGPSQTNTTSTQAFDTTNAAEHKQERKETYVLNFSKLKQFSNGRSGRKLRAKK